MGVIPTVPILPRAGKAGSRSSRSVAGLRSITAPLPALWDANPGRYRHLCTHHSSPYDAVASSIVFSPVQITRS